MKTVGVGAGWICLVMLLIHTAHCGDILLAQSCGSGMTAVPIGCAEHGEVELEIRQIGQKLSTDSDDGKAELLVPRVSVSVYDAAGLSAELLTRTEEQLTRIFAQAGIETLWLNCFPAPDVPIKDCYLADSHHLILKILPRALVPKVRERLDVLGTAIVDGGVGLYAYVFYDRVLELSTERKLGNALLACVIAHEIGHLLLGSSAHSVNGLMSPHWTYDELRRVSEGQMHFDDSQARIMRSHLSNPEHGGGRGHAGEGDLYLTPKTLMQSLVDQV